MQVSAGEMEIADVSSTRDLGRPLAWLLALGAAVVFVSVYAPARARARREERLVERAQAVIARERAANAALRDRCEALAAAVPDAVAEELRTVLRKGGAGEYVLGREE